VGALQSRSKPGFFISISLTTEKKKKKTGEKKKKQFAKPSHTMLTLSFPSLLREKKGRHEKKENHKTPM
jgi:hypothetical protein